MKARCPPKIWQSGLGVYSISVAVSRYIEIRGRDLRKYRWTTGERLKSLRVFGCLPDTNARGCTEAGVRKASREETAREFAPTLVSVYGEFAAAA